MIIVYECCKWLHNDKTPTAFMFNFQKIKVKIFDKIPYDENLKINSKKIYFDVCEPLSDVITDPW